MSEIGEGLLSPKLLDEFWQLFAAAARECPTVDDRVRLANWVDPHGGNVEFCWRLISAARESAKLAERVKELEGASSEAGSLECPHCGDDAIRSATGTFGDGDGDQCVSCGFPGHVSVDDSGDHDGEAYWSVSEDGDARCAFRACLECNEQDEYELAAQTARAEAAEARVRELAWIASEERLPEEGTLALGLTHGGTTAVVAYCRTDGAGILRWYVPGLAAMSLEAMGGISHWMPVPKGPEL